MSRFFEAYLPQIQNLLRTRSKTKSYKKNQTSSQHFNKSQSQIPYHTNVILQCPKKNNPYFVEDNSSNRNEPQANNYNIFSTNFTNFGHYLNQQNGIQQVKSPIVKTKSTLLNNNGMVTQTDKKKIQQKQQKEVFSQIKNSFRTYTQEMEQNTFPFSKKKSALMSKGKKSHEELRENLIKNASNQKQSQRLEMIFESARKDNKQQIHKSSQFSNKKENSILKPIKVDEVSRTILRKSFCLQMIDDDQEWDRVVTKSKKKWNEQQTDQS